MKKIPFTNSLLYIFILAIILPFCTNNHSEIKTSQRTTVSGKILNYQNDSARFVYETFRLFQMRKEHGIHINPDGEYKMVLYTDAPLKGFFSFGKEPVTHRYTITLLNGRDSTMSSSTYDFKMVYLYLEPGDSLIMNLSVDDIYASLEFDGSGAENNRFVNEEERKFNDYKHKYLGNYYYITSMEPDDYKKSVDRFKSEKVKFLEEYSSRHQLSNKIRELYMNMYQNEAVTRKIGYPGSHAYFNNLNNTPLPDDYYEFLNQIEFPDKIGNLGIGYYYYLSSVLKTLYDLNENQSDYYEFVKTKLKDKAYFEFLALSLNRDFKKKLYDQFDQDCPFPEIAHLVKEKYQHLEGMLEGNPAPDFQMKDINGEEVSLTSLKGKYIYIDFWATWCTPCKQEIPHLRALEEKYRNGGIHFVSISFDSSSDGEKWKLFVKENQMTGYQLHADSAAHKLFSETFNISTIPRFVLLDPEGRIVDANAPRPSDPKLINLFEDLGI